METTRLPFEGKNTPVTSITKLPKSAYAQVQELRQAMDIQTHELKNLKKELDLKLRSTRKGIIASLRGVMFPVVRSQMASGKNLVEVESRLRSLESTLSTLAKNHVQCQLMSKSQAEMLTRMNRQLVYQQAPRDRFMDAVTRVLELFFPGNPAPNLARLKMLIAMAITTAAVSSILLVLQVWLILR